LKGTLALFTSRQLELRRATANLGMNLRRLRVSTTFFILALVRFYWSRLQFSSTFSRSERSSMALSSPLSNSPEMRSSIF
jgi:hypothetical protein